MLDQIHKTESKVLIPKFTSKISTERRSQLMKMIETSPDKYPLIKDKILPHINVTITYEEGEAETATALTSALIMFLEKLRTQL